MKILQYLKDFYNLIYPKYCIGCGEHLKAAEQHVCSACLYDMPATYYHRYPENPVKTQFAELVNLEFATAGYFFRNGSAFRELIHQLKYSNRPKIGLFIGELCARPIQSALKEQHIDYIIPVPLHPQKQKERGYNQAAYIAQGIANITQIPVLTGVLIRTVYSTTQTAMHNKTQRMENIKGAFTLEKGALLENKHILLVDDILTTGATLEACIIPLLTIPNSKISLLTAGISHNL